MNNKKVAKIATFLLTTETNYVNISNSNKNSRKNSQKNSKKSRKKC